MDAYINGSKIRLDPTKSIGKGGEADVYDIGSGKVLKVFKQPNHPDFSGEPAEQQAATQRIDVHQTKLKAFPKNLPDHVVVPVDLAYDQQGSRIIGYTMRFLKGCEVLMRFADKTFRQAGIPNDVVGVVFRDLYTTVDGIHANRVVIGDFNDLNVLVHGQTAYIIDADSFQFGSYLCQMFTSRFVDPLLCDPRAKSLQLTKPHGADSDWYAFTVMLMQSLLFVDPYGGIYRPKDPTKNVPHDSRPLHRITVFHPDVRYPKPAIPYGVLPDDLLQHFHLVFEKDRRGNFPLTLLETLKWQKCSTCGTEHARSVCPSCKQAAPAAIKEVTKVRGNVTATRLFRTTGVILFAAYQNGELRWLFHESDEYLREKHASVMHGPLDPHMRFRLQDDTTLVGKDNQLITIKDTGAGKDVDRLNVDSFGLLPIFDANSQSRFWVSAGVLYRDGRYGQERIGDVLSGQTLFWVGPKFGFGFYRAGNLSIAFVFDAEKGGINDSVTLPPIRGQLVDSTCAFSDSMCWFFTTTRESGKTVNRCTTLKANGTIVASAEAQEGDGSWLGKIRGSCAAGNFLLVPTDDGVLRVEPQGTQLATTRSFPDTEPFVDAASHLFAGRQGLYVVGKQDIQLLQIK